MFDEAATLTTASYNFISAFLSVSGLNDGIATQDEYEEILEQKDRGESDHITHT